MHLYVATSNPGKLADFAHAASSPVVARHKVTILPLPNLQSIPPPIEDASTFAGNALLKALAYGALAPHEIVLADDSGIAVRGLGGAPGVRSARYADDECFASDPHATTDQRNTTCLLDRAARLRYRDVSYLCALAAVRDGALLATGSGELQGRLMDAPRGTGGFGYDPIFELLELGQTMAEIDPDTRLRTSHRGRALIDLLRNLLNSAAQPLTR